ncbi:UDP-glycosyltransferase 76B1 [Neltuma alba]|uniref:UDP-glycosyltransferase 76B1 n=1 Tax=Neltuma alba TaxID=207710 RepID=UPI0010A4C3B3|nr:UDP-glycosyltransferase 76B1-like [Prosopis alba]
MERERKGLSLVLIPSPLQGHIAPLLELANILYCSGFSIIISHTLFNSPNPSAYPHFTFVPFSDELSQSEASTSDPLHLTNLINLRCAHPLSRCLSHLLSDPSLDPIACLISDAALHFTRSVCDSLHLPRLVLRTGGASSFLVFSLFPLLRSRGYLPIEESRGEEAVAELPPLKVKDLPKIETKDPEAFYEFVCRMVDELKLSSGVIWNTFEELESYALEKLTLEFSIPIYPIGPFHKHLTSGSLASTALMTPDESCIPWLDTQEPNSVVYVSFGSIAAITQTQLVEMAWGLANSKQAFLWVLRPGLVPGSQWLEPLPDGFIESLGGRGHVVKWAPQGQVLSHPAVGAFWTHNGWNSTLESVCEGVPMICMPCFADQKVNAKYVSDVWKVGIQLPNELQRGEVEQAIQRIMVEDEGKAIRERALQLKEKADLCLQQGGSSRRSLDRLITHIFSSRRQTHPSEKRE